MPDQVKNILIGLFVLSALFILGFILLYLHPTVGDEKQVLYVRFSDIDKVNVGTRVTFAGKAIGEVDEISSLGTDRTGPSDEYGKIYSYVLKLVIDSGVKVYDVDQFSLRTSGLLGERSVAITPKIPQKGHVPRLIKKDDVLYATEAGSMEDTIKEFKEVADKFDSALDEITATLQDLRKEEVVKKLSYLIENVGEIAAALNSPEELSSIVTNIEDATSQFANRLSPTWDALDEGVAGFRCAMNETKIAAADMRCVFGTICRGEGSLGAFVMKEDLYLQLKSVLNKAEIVANDVNHYGLLFHLDKGWQRLRARRMNLLDKLCSPQEFRNYFNDEMDQISTSLSRVYLILDEIDCMCPYYEVGGDEDFRKVFAELLRRAEVLGDALKMYNQQLMNAEVYQTELQQQPCCY